MNLQTKGNMFKNISPWTQDTEVIFSHSSGQYTSEAISARKMRKLSTARTQRQKKMADKESFGRPQSAVELQSQEIKKIPLLFSASSSQLSQKQKINKKFERLGLQDFMKQIVTGEASKNCQLSNKIIFALNRTYISRNIQSPRKSSTVSINPKKSKPHLNQPQFFEQKTKDQPHQFLFNQEQAQSFIPNTMFPYRKSHTKVLRGKQYGRYNAKKIEQDTCIQSEINQSRKRLFQQYLKKIALTKQKQSSTYKHFSSSYSKKSKNPLPYHQRKTKQKTEKDNIKSKLAKSKITQNQGIISKKAVIYK